MLTPRQKQVKDYIDKFISTKGVAPSEREIARKFKISPSTVHELLTRLQKKGYLEKAHGQARGIRITESISQMVQIPLLGAIAAGKPIEAIQEKETIAVQKGKLSFEEDVFALRVAGDSMIDENIFDGDVVLVKQQTTAHNGEKIVALIDNWEVTLKKYYRERGFIRLQPANKELEPIIIKSNREFRIQGVVIDIIKHTPTISFIPFLKTEKNTLEEQKITDLENTVTEGDCLEIMKRIPSKSIQLILCDLPYGTTQNPWDSVIPLDRLWEHYERIIKDNGVIALTGQGLFSAQLMMSNPKLFKYKIVWVKSKPTNFLNAKKQPLRKHEDILIFYKNQPDYHPQMTQGEPYNKGFRKDQLTGSYGDFSVVEVKSNGERYPTDVVYFKTAESEGEVVHPTQKPVELGRYLIRTFTNPDDVVLDNTCGSGSFLISAVLEGRKFIGIEKNEEVYLFKNKKIDYIEICNNRIKAAKKLYKASNSKLF